MGGECSYTGIISPATYCNQKHEQLKCNTKYIELMINKKLKIRESS